MIYEDLFPSFSLFPRTGSTLFPQISYSLQYIDVHKKKIIRNKQQFVFLRRWTVFCLPPFVDSGEACVRRALHRRELSIFTTEQRAHYICAALCFFCITGRCSCDAG